MPETGTNMLSYTGNAGLGTGTNTDIPAFNPNNNLDVINDTAKNIMLTNHDTAIKLYDQKIKDRDATLQLLQNGQIASGNIDPNDRPYYENARKDAESAFYDMINNGGVNNREAVSKYNEKVANLKNVTDWAQNRELGLAALQKEKADQTLPADQKLYDDAITKAKQQPFWNPIPVVQKAFKYDVNGLTQGALGQPTTLGSLGATSTPTQTTTYHSVTSRTDKNGNVLPTTKTTTKVAPVKSGLINNKTSKQPITISSSQQNPDGTLSPISYTPESYWDLGKIQQNVVDNNTNPETRYGYESYMKDFQDPNITPAPQQKSTIEALNNRLAQYAQQRGFSPVNGQTNPDGTPKYQSQINYLQNPDGTVTIQETPQSFFAKHALASVNGDYVQKPEASFDKEIGAYNIQMKKANADSFYKHAMANAANKKANAYAANIGQQMKLRKSADDQDEFLNEVYTRNLLQQPTLIQSGEKRNSFYLAPIKAENSLPVFTISGNKAIQLQPIGATAKTNKGKFQYWEGGHYEPQYLINNKPLKQDEISAAYDNFKKQAGSNWKGGINDWIKEAVKSGLMDFSLKGANGTTDKYLSNAAQRIISNTTTKKGQEGVFSDAPPLDDQIPDSPDNSQ